MAPQSQQPQPLLNRLTNFDNKLSLTLYTLSHPILPHSLLKLLEFSGDGRLFFPLILSSLALSSPSHPLFPLLVNLLAGSITDLMIIGLIKHIVKRPRPSYNQNMSLVFSVDHWSFPSGHSSRVCFISGLICLSGLEIDGFDKVGRVLVCVCVCVWAGVTSVSRVLLGRHYVFDVIVGACLGILNAVVVFWFLNYDNLASFFS